jgi:hypothetical protein
MKQVDKKEKSREDALIQRELKVWNLVPCVRPTEIALYLDFYFTPRRKGAYMDISYPYLPDSHKVDISNPGLYFSGDITSASANKIKDFICNQVIKLLNSREAPSRGEVLDILDMIGATFCNQKE